MASNQVLKKAKYALRFLSDERYIRLYYRFCIGRKLDLSAPRAYNEKIQWLKLHDRRPEYVAMVDKASAKDIAVKVVGAEHIVPTLGVYDCFDDIDFASLPNRFVLKATHDSEGSVVVADKNAFDKIKARKKLTRALKYNFYYIGREWPYKQVKPRILVEEMLIGSASSGDLPDYKFFCFDGEPRILYVASGRTAGDTRFDFFDLDFRHLDIMQHYPNSDTPLAKPRHFEEMIDAARSLSQGFPHIRIDFFSTQENWYFGEYTFYHMSGFSPFYPDGWDYKFGSWIDLSLDE